MTNWSIQSLPSSAPAGTDITAVAFDGRTPLLATTDGLYRGSEASGDYARDDELRDGMRTAGLPAAVRVVATVDARTFAVTEPGEAAARPAAPAPSPAPDDDGGFPWPAVLLVAGAAGVDVIVAAVARRRARPGTRVAPPA